MGTRGRLIITAVVALVVVFAMWSVVVSPETGKASKLLGQISSERAQLAGAQQKVLAAEQARREYPADVRSLAVLSEAVPPGNPIPQLIDLINSVEVKHKVNYTSTTLTPGAATGGLEPVSLSFAFIADYLDLQRFLQAFDSLTQTNGSSVLVNGRLVSVNSISLTSNGSSLTAAVTMTAYQTTPAAPATATVAAVTP
jgi:Tfp pilus assembly protein PilO